MEENGAGRIGRKQNFTRVLLLFWPFSFSFFSFPPFAFGESKTAPVRAAEKVMDRALNVGSHGIWDVGDRCVAPIGSHRPPPRRANGRRGRTRERENARVEREETWRGFLEQLGNETTTTIMRAVRTTPCTREKKLSSSRYFRASAIPPTS